jgi:N-carbamoyl-L-amino-acid hydrolase
MPVDFGPTVPEAVARAAAAQGLKAIRLPSGAFHDAQFLVPVCPTGMIFIPCRAGVSHHPSEYAEPVACANGARVLTQALLDLAGT